MKKKTRKGLQFQDQSSPYFSSKIPLRGSARRWSDRVEIKPHKFVVDEARIMVVVVVSSSGSQFGGIKERRCWL
jgi:hypothetical protein